MTPELSRQLPPAGVYAISVAAELTGVPPQTLRTFETKGLLDPVRTAGGTRRYSEQDVERVGHITALLDAGVNLEGVRRLLVLEAEAERLRVEVTRLRRRSR